MPTNSANAKSANTSHSSLRRTSRAPKRLALALAVYAASISVWGHSNAKATSIPPTSPNPLTISSARRHAGALLISDNNYDRLGMQKLAEMAAVARHNEGCPAAPRAWSIAFIVLVMTNPPPEAQVEIEEKKMLALRRKIGRKRWCALYRVEMHEADLIYRLTTGR